MTVRHNNTSQEAEISSFNPLLQDESPYYKNINRAPKNSYDYADSINKTFSYSGCVSRVLSLGNQQFNLYDIVAVLPNEIIDNVRTTTQTITRYGMVVTLQDDEGYYVIITFCPNFVYPSEVVSAITGFVSPSSFSSGLTIYLDTNPSNTSPQNNYWLTTSTSGLPTPVIQLGKITGPNSIFFSGSFNIF
jgi:hypothetical protein